MATDWTGHARKWIQPILRGLAVLPLVAIHSPPAAAQGPCALSTASDLFCATFESAGSLPAQADSITLDQGATESIDVLANDGGSGTLTVIIAQPPSHGVATVGSDNRITYMPNIPNATYLGDDSFQYRVTDQAGHSGTATVNVSVTCPTAVCDRTFVLSWDAVNHPSAVGYCVYHATAARPAGATPGADTSARHYGDRQCVGNVTDYEWTLAVTTGTDYFAVSTLADDQSESAYSTEFRLVSY